MSTLLSVLGVIGVLALSAWGVPRLKRRLKEKQRTGIENALRSNLQEEREEARRWLLERGTGDELDFARRLLSSNDFKVVLDIAPLLVCKGGPVVEYAVDALARVVSEGNEHQREEAVTALFSAPRLFPSIIRPLSKMLSVEPSVATRVKIILTLARVAKADAPEKLDSFLKADIVKAVAGCLRDESQEVSGCATACLEPRGPLAYLIKDAELPLMELLRSPRRDVVDGVGKLILAHRHTLRAAMSCLAASEASPKLKDSIS